MHVPLFVQRRFGYLRKKNYLMYPVIPGELHGSNHCCYNRVRRDGGKLKKWNESETRTFQKRPAILARMSSPIPKLYSPPDGRTDASTRLLEGEIDGLWDSAGAGPRRRYGRNRGGHRTVYVARAITRRGVRQTGRRLGSGFGNDRVRYSGEEIIPDLPSGGMFGECS